MSLPTISPLRGLVEVTRLLRAREDLPALLDAVARTIGESLGYQTVAVNLYRPEWDDFEVTTVHGNEEARGDAARQRARPATTGRSCSADRFERRGAYDVPAGSVDWDVARAELHAAGRARVHPDAWDPEDALFVPMRDHRGLLLGIVSVDEPVSGRRADRRRPRDSRLARRSRGPRRRGGARGGGVRAAPARARGAARRVVPHHRRDLERRDPAPGVHAGSARRSTSATSAGRSSISRPACSFPRRRRAGSSRTCAGAIPSPSPRRSRCSTRCSCGRAATSSPTSRRARGSATRSTSTPRS